MKRLLIVLCIVFPMLANAQQNYQIKSVIGEVTLRHTNKTSWIKANALVYVDLDDILNVKKGGNVTIVEKSTGRVFVSAKTGKISVQNRLIDAEKNAQSVFSSLNSKVRESVKKHGNDTRHYGSIGVVTRGCDTCPITVDIYDSVYANILYFSNTYQSDYEINGIEVEKIYVPEGTLSITLKNTSDKPYFCNVVNITDGQPSICYYFEDMDFIPLESGDRVDLTSFPLNKDDSQYLLIVSENNLSVELLQATFDGKHHLQPCELKNVRVIKL